MRSLSISTVLLAGTFCLAAPALADKPVSYEYAELRYSRTIQAIPAAPGPVGGRAGIPVNQRVTVVTVRWTTADGEIEATEWEGLAQKLKAPVPKKAASATVHKLRVLNRLSAEGWEIVPHPVLETSPSGVWQFRRRLP